MPFLAWDIVGATAITHTVHTEREDMKHITSFPSYAYQYMLDPSQGNSAPSPQELTALKKHSFKAESSLEHAPRSTCVQVSTSGSLKWSQCELPGMQVHRMQPCAAITAGHADPAQSTSGSSLCAHKP